MRRAVSRRGFLAAAGVTALAGCADEAGVRSGSDGRTGSGTGDRAAAAPGGSDADSDVPPSFPPTAEETLPLPLSPAEVGDRAVSGGPPKDGIPSIDEPSFEPADSVDDRLAPGDPVFGVAGESTVKAYPQSILVYHEICNDAIDGRPVSVTYCPLTGTAMGFLRGDTGFGVSGRLVNNNLIMYDWATDSWWPQVLATAVPSGWNEDPPVRSLRGFPVVWTTWERWRQQHPETRVLTRDTGYARNYDADPYGDYNPRRGYYAPDHPPMFGTLNPDDRFEPKTVVVGARTPEGAIAFRKDALRASGVVEGDLAGTRHVAVYDEALDTGYVYRNPRARHAAPRDGQVVLDGTAHPPADLPMERVLALDAMWFAWIGFYPGSTVYG